MAEISTPHFSAADDRLIGTLYNALPDAIIGSELSSGRILHWNNAATAMFGLPAADAVGKKLEFIFADRESFQSFAIDLTSAIRTHGSWRTKQEVYRHAGAKIYTDITATLVRPRKSHGEYVVLVFHERARTPDADTDPETYTHYQEIIADLGRRALGDAQIDSLMDGAVKGVAEALGADYSSVLELLPGGNELLLRAGVGWEHGRIGEAKIDAAAASQESYTLESGKPVTVEDIKQETRFNGIALLRDREIVSGISVIIRGRSRPYGILCAYAARQRTFTRDDIHFFLSIADLLSNAIERKRIERELQSLNGRLLEIVRERTKLLQLLQEIAIVANEASGIDSALEVTIDKICKETSFPCPETALLIGHVYRLITTDATPRVDYWYLSNLEVLAPFRAASEAIHFDYGVGLIGRVLTSRKLEWTADLTHEGSDPRAQAAEKIGLKTAIAFPILAGHDVVAVMEMFTSETLTPEAPLLEALSQIGIALGRIVERKLTEERLRQNELLVAIGSTAAKLAHDISNPLNGMYTSTQLLERACKDAASCDDDIIPSTVKGLKQEVDRLRALLHEFRTLSGLTKFDFEVVDVSEIAREVADLKRSDCARQAVTIELDFPVGLPKLTLDREKIKQALFNLCENAVDAMPRGGILTIRGYRFWEAICVEVHDTGPGVPERMNVFEIFTTTKHGGTGLGLPIVQQIIAGHRGSVTFASESGKGTVFRLTLPINAKS